VHNISANFEIADNSEDILL